MKYFIIIILAFVACTEKKQLHSEPCTEKDYSAFGSIKDSLSFDSLARGLTDTVHLDSPFKLTPCGKLPYIPT